jgi:hypothetical protein
VSGAGSAPDPVLLIEPANKPRVTGSTGPNKFTPGSVVKAINGAVKTVVGALLPKAKTTTVPAPASNSPDPGPEPSSPAASSGDPGGGDPPSE